MSNYRNPVYLGDGAYAQIDEWGDLLLTTGAHAIPGVEPSNVVCLEGPCLALLFKYIAEHAPNGSQNYTIKRIGT